MRVLFVCSASIVEKKIKCASWIKSIIVGISKSFEITIASTDLSHTDIEVGFVDDISVNIIAFESSKSYDDRKDILKAIKTDAIIIFGTEKPSTFYTLRLCKDLGLLDKTAVFAQGLCCVCAQHYAEGIPERIIKRFTFRDMLRRQNIKKERDSLQNRAILEQKALELTHNFIGRTTMDKAILKSYNPNANYYKCNDVLRSCFYEGQWTYEGCKKHRIFISQYYYPLKGFHYLLEAAALLKSKYPDLLITAAGYNPVLTSLVQNEFKDSSYIRYIKSLVKKYGLNSHIELLGELSEEQMKSQYLRANVFVMPSTIENSPNSLAEAMMLGVPTIASDVGGVTDFAKHQEEAFIYPSSATYLLAHYIDNVFSDNEKANNIAHNGKVRAQREYDLDNNIKQFETILRKLSGNNE